MANRYWVSLISADWDATAGLKWSTTSGGIGGAAVPTDTDDVFFDANSGATTVTHSGTRVCRNLDFTGFTGTFAGSGTHNTAGSLTLGSGMTLTYTGTFNFESISSPQTITSNGKAFSSSFLFNTAGITWQLQDDLVSGSGNTITVSLGTFDANGKNVTVGGFNSSGSGVRALIMGSGLWTLTGLSAWNTTTTTNLTFDAGTSTIKLTDASASAKTFLGGGLTFNNILFSGAGTGTFDISGSNTFNDFAMDTPPHTVRFIAGTTNTVTTFAVSGTTGNLMTIASQTAANHDLVKAGGGVIARRFLSVSRSQATPASTWYAGASTDGGNNSGWIFGTRYYLRGTAESVPISPTPDAAWEDTTIIARGVARSVHGTDALADVAFADSNAADRDVLFRQIISPALAAGQTITGSQALEAQCRVAERIANNNMFFAMGIRVLAANGTTVQKTVLTVTRDGLEADASATLENRRLTAPSTATDYVTAAGDYLVIEYGMAGDPSGGGSPDHDSTMRLGDNNATDLPEDDTTTADNNPWVELIDTLLAQGAAARARPILIEEN